MFGSSITQKKRERDREKKRDIVSSNFKENVEFNCYLNTK